MTTKTSDFVGLFAHHPFALQQQKRSDRIRQAAVAMADAIDRNCPLSSDRENAIRKLRECVWMANASIAFMNLCPVCKGDGVMVDSPLDGFITCSCCMGSGEHPLG